MYPMRRDCSSIDSYKLHGINVIYEISKMVTNSTLWKIEFQGIQ